MTTTPATGITALPDFPWDSLAGAKERAAAHPDGLVDLSVGTPVDPVPQAAQTALAEAANSPGYPLTSGTADLQAAMAGYLTRRWGAEGLVPEATMPVIGTKEFVAWLPTLLGLGPGDVVVVPTMAYPTYAVGAMIAGCTPIPADDLDGLDDQRVGLVWLNSPSNPTGQILGPDELARRVAWARDHGAVVASDECYGEFGWDTEPVSVLRPDVCRGSHDQLLAVHSLSKRSNLAGYRAGFIGGDHELVTRLLAVRKHAGMIVPRPVQQAMITLLADDDHVQQQRGRYLARRELLRPALERAGFRIEHSEGSLYLWATRDEPGRASIDFLAGHGILAAPGDFYGAAADGYVRVALTATDDRIAAAATRLTQ
ncbi:succinyldiaminopimelate transaminase [Microlunatus speluncae]|uniref:succinyldiaminopimelate transaminase n=1 Tax=Microlunatus speluncae TaxID=2594267 RepID=UPI0024840DF1|nr:succinyldiaminopimelate transaminase [Microlunatus speluncae]